MFKMSCPAILNPCVTKLIGGPLPIYNLHKALEEIYLHYFRPLRFWSYLSLQHYLGLTDITSSLKFKLLLLLLFTLLLLQLLPIINNIFITLYMSIAPPTSRDLLQRAMITSSREEEGENTVITLQLHSVSRKTS